MAIATDNIKKNANSYNVYVYDAKTLQLSYEKKYFENPDSFFKSFDMSIDDNGDIYAVGKEYKEGKREKKGENPNYNIVLHKISAANVASNRIELNENQHIADLKIIPKANSIHLYGFYSKEYAGKISGLNKITVNKNNLQEYNMQQTSLPETVLTDLYTVEKAENKKDKDLTNYYLDYVIEDEQGNITLLAEKFYLTQTYVSNGINGGGHWVTHYHYDNILVIRINSAGNLVWGRSIFKKAGYPSYNAFMVDDNLHVLLNTGKLKTKKDGRVKAKTGWLQSTALFDYIYNKNGEVTQEKIKENKGGKHLSPG